MTTNKEESKPLKSAALTTRLSDNSSEESPRNTDRVPEKQDLPEDTEPRQIGQGLLEKSEPAKTAKSPSQEVEQVVNDTVGKTKSSGSLSGIKDSLTTMGSVLERAANKVAHAALFVRFGGTKEKALGIIEKKLYNNKHHTGHGLLIPHGIINQSQAEIDPGLARCTSSKKCFFIALAMLTSVLVTGCTAPMTFMFNGSFSKMDLVPGRWSVVMVDMTMDAIYAIYLMERLNMSFIHSKRHVEIVCKKEVRAYWFHNVFYRLSILSVTPYLWAACGCGMWINLLKCVRMLHLLDLPDSLWQIRDSLKLRLSLYVLMLFMAAHWVACVLCAVGGYRERWEQDNAWGRSYYDGELVEPLFSLYFEAFVEALYMLIGALDNPKGDGSIREMNIGGMAIVIIMGPVGCVVVSIFVSAVCRMLELSSALEIRQAQNLSFIDRALENLDVPKGLRKRVMCMHQFQKMNHDNEALGVLFSKNTLSKPLECALRVYLYSSVLDSPFFHGRNEDYILEVVGALDDEVYLPGDYLARRGELASAMYFVGSGILSVLVPAHAETVNADKAKLIKELRKGEYFGEVALIKACRRTAWVRAETYVVAQVLTKSRLDPIWRFFTDERELLAAKVADTVKKDRKLQVNSKWRLAEKQVVQLIHDDSAQRSRWGSMHHASGRPLLDGQAELASMAYDDDEDAHADVRSAEDVLALHELSRLCGDMLEEQHHSEGALAALTERQDLLEKAIDGVTQDPASSKPGSSPVIKGLTQDSLIEVENSKARKNLETE